MEYAQEQGFAAKITASQFAPFADRFISLGYTTSQEANFVDLKVNSATFSEHPPQFVHAYVNKTFGSIPALYIAPPFEDSSRYSQLAMTYMLSYFLGMLTRYFPTQWVALAGGAKGDEIWPAINAAQKYIESSFPELLLELILDRIAQCQPGSA
jgi:hypothetical protein